MTHFRAPWSKSLIVASTFATLVCVGVTYGMWTLPMDASLEPLRFWLGLLPLAVILVCALFTVRSYSIANDDSFNRPAVLENARLAPRTPVRQIRSHRYTPEHSHVRQRRLFFFHRLLPQQRFGLLPRVHDRSASRGGATLPVLRDRDLPRPTGGLR